MRLTAIECRLDMLASLYPVRDMRLGGQVIHTGKSSMEIAVRMEALSKDGTEQTIMLGMTYIPLDMATASHPSSFDRSVLHGLQRRADTSCNPR